MAEQLKQVDDNVEGQQIMEREIINCSMCEDSGACNFCSRGRQWLIDNPKPIHRPTKKRGKGR